MSRVRIASSAFKFRITLSLFFLHFFFFECSFFNKTSLTTENWLFGRELFCFTSFLYVCIFLEKMFMWKIEQQTFWKENSELWNENTFFCLLFKSLKRKVFYKYFVIAFFWTMKTNIFVSKKFRQNGDIQKNFEIENLKRFWIFVIFSNFLCWSLNLSKILFFNFFQKYFFKIVEIWTNLSNFEQNKK